MKKNVVDTFFKKKPDRITKNEFARLIGAKSVKVGYAVIYFEW